MENIYESSRLLDEYLLFHYGSLDEALSDNGISYPLSMKEAWGFPSRTARGFSNGKVDRGLDLGCSVGAATFAMAEHCREVIGIDYSHSFIAAAERLRNGQQIPYHRVDEGHVATLLHASLKLDFEIKNIIFEQGDAHHLREDLGTFDRVHAANLLCRLSNPNLLLERFPSLVRDGGELLIATPCTWLENFTPSIHWPSGSTLDWLKSHLERSFDLARTWDEPFLIRETARKFQWSTSQVSLWRRKS